jgi:DNA-binding IclR family transcriptional regulator
MALLEAIVLDDGRTQLSELAQAAGLPPSTARRLTLAMLRSGFICRVSRGHYGVGQRVLALAGKCSPTELVIARARGPANKIARQLGVTVHVGILEDDMVTYVVKEHGGGPQLFTREGQQMEAYCTALGKMLLSTLSPHDRDEYLSQNPFVALTSRTLTEPEQLKAELDQVADQDFATENWETAEGVQCLAMPIRKKNGEVIAAISIARRDAVTALWPTQTGAMLRRTATDISRRVSSIL